MTRFLLAFLAVLGLATAGQSHEVRPAIGDFSTQNGVFTLQLRLIAEPIVAGVDLEGVMDTNDTENSDLVDELRALDPLQMADRLRGRLPEIVARMNITVDGAPLALAPVDVRTDVIGNVALPRESLVVLRGDLPTRAQVVEITWPSDYGTMILRQQGVEEPYTGYLAGQSTGPIQLGGTAMSAWEAFVRYIPVGFAHILPLGLDHILFVLGLFFLTTRAGPLLWQISAFTLAHTVTLALGALGLVTVPASVVEPIIAASIVFVALENLVSDRMHRWRPLVIFAFGLLHGLGFASVLQMFGLPQGQFVSALIGFNIGVEIGQLAVIAVAFLVVWFALRVTEGRASLRSGQIVYGIMALAFVALAFLPAGTALAAALGGQAGVFFWPLAALAVACLIAITRMETLEPFRRFVAMPASLAIACVGAYWFVERVFL